MGNKSIESYVNEAKRGNKESFGKLFELTYHRAYYTALKITENPKDAEDMVQEAYIKAFTSIDTLNDDSKFEKWLNRIVANKCRDLAKKRRPDLFSDYENEESDIPFEESLESFDLSVLPEEVTENKAVKNIVMQCIDALPFEQRLCVIMYYYNELSVNEIADSLAIPVGTVKSRLNKARKTLKKQFEDIQSKENIKLYSASLPLMLAAVLKVGGDNYKIPIFSLIKIAKKTPYVLSDNTFLAIFKTIGLSTVLKRIIAGIGAVAIVTGGSMAARDIINDNKAQLTTTSVVSAAKTTAASTTKSKQKASTKKTDKKILYKSTASSAVAVSDNNKNTYFINSNGVFRLDKNNKKIKISSHKPLNLCYGDCLMYIYNGVLYQYKNSKLSEYMKVSGDYLYSAKYKLVSISKDKNSAFIIDINKKNYEPFKEGCSDFKYLGKKIYYRNSYNEIKCATVKKNRVEFQNIMDFDNGESMLPYTVKNSKIYYTDFYSDITGIINIKDIETGNVEKINLAPGIIDFAVSNDRIYYSAITSGLYYYSEKEGSKRISDGCFYCSATSKGNMIWCSTDGLGAFLVKSDSDGLIEIKNGSSIIEFSIVDGILFYRGDNGYGSVKL